MYSAVMVQVWLQKKITAIDKKENFQNLFFFFFTQLIAQNAFKGLQEFQNFLVEHAPRLP